MCHPISMLAILRLPINVWMKPSLHIVHVSEGNLLDTNITWCLKLSYKVLTALLFVFFYFLAYAEDCPSIGTFTYRLKGFDEPPTDHYMRTYYVAANPEFGAQKSFCMGSVPRHKAS